jgi:cbb3-type cytochrome oxidase subunit 3
MLTWWLLRHFSPLWVLAALLAFSILAAYPLFGPGPQNANDYSYEACTSSLLHPWYPCGEPPAPEAQP